MNIMYEFIVKFEITSQILHLYVDPFYFFFVQPYDGYWPIPVTERSKARVCGRSFAGIAGSNPAAGMGVCLL